MSGIDKSDDNHRNPDQAAIEPAPGIGHGRADGIRCDENGPERHSAEHEVPVPRHGERRMGPELGCVEDEPHGCRSYEHP